MLLRSLVHEALPMLDRILCAHDIDLSLITLHWFITLFAGVLHTRLLLRIWDLFFYEGILTCACALSQYNTDLRNSEIPKFRLQFDVLPKLESCYTH